MNRTIVILNLLVSSISIARPIGDETINTAKVEDENSKTGDIILRSPDETVHVLEKNDDVLRTSELNNIYSSPENKYAKTRSLKEESENNRFTKDDLKQESRIAIKSKVVDKLDEKPKEKSATTDKTVEIKTKAAKKDESRSAEKSETTSKSVNVESKNIKEESKTVEVTSDSSDLESTTANFRTESKTPDYLETDKEEYSEKLATDDDSDRKGYDMPINDESNTAWDLLDDLPPSRRTLSPLGNLNLDYKARSGDVNDEPVEPAETRNFPEPTETRNVPEPIETRNVLKTRNHNLYGNVIAPPTNPVMSMPQLHSTPVNIPQNYPSILPRRRFIVPGFVTIRPAVSIDFRRLLNQERNSVINQDNVQHETDYRTDRNYNNMNDQIQNNAYVDRSEIPPESRRVDYNSNEHSNAYPYTPAVFERPRIPQAENPLFTKLIEASEHPQNVAPNFNAGNVRNIPSLPYLNNVGRNYYALPQNYGIYKYVTGFRRSR